MKAESLNHDPDFLFVKKSLDWLQQVEETCINMMLSWKGWDALSASVFVINQQL